MQELEFNHQLVDHTLTISLHGNLRASSTGPIWRTTDRLLKEFMPEVVIIDASRLDACDGTGISYLRYFQVKAEAHGAVFSIQNLNEKNQRLLKIYRKSSFPTLKTNADLFSNIPNTIGRLTYSVYENLRLQISFIGEIFYEFMIFLKSPGRLRWQETFHIMELTGANAVGIVALIGFLLGLILAFQAAIPLSQFGVEIFVADMVGLSLTRELGPLITAVVVAGRSGSAYAAEIGTMKVNEELSALDTMGIGSIRFLVLPRLLAMLTMMPMLVLVFIFLGLIGGSIVLLSMGYPLVTYMNGVFRMVDMFDFLGGMLKCMVFALLVAGVGCYQGLHTGSGASAVGNSTTRAVVNGIILIAVTDGSFAVLFYFLGI